MTARAGTARQTAEPASLVDKLNAVVRPEFAVEVYFPGPDDPVLDRGRCAVEGCGRLAWGRGLCGSHYDRWQRQGKPDVEAWVATARPLAARPGLRRTQCFDLRPLPAQLRLEVAYALQSRQDARGFGPDRPQVARAVKLLAGAGAASVLDRSPESWRALARSWGWRDLGCIAFVRYAHTVVGDLASGRQASDEYERDTWDARRLGIPSRPPNYLVRFGPISQHWLRDAAKAWARFRLATGRAVTTVANDAHGLGWFSRFVSCVEPSHRDETVVTRTLLEAYLSHLASAGLADQTRLGYLVSLRMFLDDCRRHNFLAKLPAEARLYQEDMPHHGEYLPRFVPELVMAQLEADAALARLPDDTTRHLVTVLVETGLRAGDACNLSLGCVVDDSVGWPCLRYFNSKVRAEQVVPLSPKAALALRAQAELVRRDWPRGIHFCSLAPGATPTAHCRSHTRRWSRACAAGRPT
jgi:integrase